MDAWLEGKENLESGDDPLAPIHKVESLMNGIALKEIVSQAPENPTATETNSMHADFGDTYTTMNTNTQTAIGVNGDTYTSNPGVAGDTYTNTPPRSPRGTSVHTSGVGRPPILTSGQLQPASMQSTGNYGYSTGANMLTSMGNTTAEPESRTKPEARGFVPEMMSSPTSGQVRQGAPAPFAAAGHAELSPARDVLDLSPRPSVGLDGRSSKVPDSLILSFSMPCRVVLKKHGSSGRQLLTIVFYQYLGSQQIHLADPTVMSNYYNIFSGPAVSVRWLKHQELCADVIW